MINKKSFVLVVLILLISISCGGEKMTENINSFVLIKDIPEYKWKSLSEKKIYFGHQSVGNNIMEGLKDVIKENPKVKLNIVETSDPEMFKLPTFAHSRVGRNQEPLSKNEAFAKFIENGIGEKADFAFFKYCYVDVPAGTDVNKLFNGYRDTMSRLKKEYPRITFIHVAVPLTVVQTGPKVWIKKIIGRPLGGYTDNIKRNEFNRLLKKEYEGKEPIFDLAMIESTFPDGKKSTFEKGEQSFYSLVPDYTKDGRHLNEKGRRIVAEQLLIFLANLSSRIN
jgi:hypothetical protein